MDFTASREQTLNAMMFTSNIFFHSETVPSTTNRSNITNEFNDNVSKKLNVALTFGVLVATSFRHFSTGGYALYGRRGSLNSYIFFNLLSKNLNEGRCSTSYRKIDNFRNYFREDFFAL